MAQILNVKQYKAYHSDCGATLSFKKSEAKKQYIKDYGGGGDNYYVFPCPNCGTLVYQIDFNLKEVC